MGGQIRECQNRPEGMSVVQWCSQNGITKANYYYRLRRVRKSCLEGLTEEMISQSVVLVPAGLLDEDRQGFGDHYFAVNVPENITVRAENKEIADNEWTFEYAPYTSGPGNINDKRETFQILDGPESERTDSEGKNIRAFRIYFNTARYGLGTEGELERHDSIWDINEAVQLIITYDIPSDILQRNLTTMDDLSVLEYTLEVNSLAVNLVQINTGEEFVNLESYKLVDEKGQWHELTRSSSPTGINKDALNYFLGSEGDNDIYFILPDELHIRITYKVIVTGVLGTDELASNTATLYADHTETDNRNTVLEVPEGYRLEDKYILFYYGLKDSTIKITDGAEIVPPDGTLTVKDPPIGYTLPETGGPGTFFYLTTGLALMMGGGILLMVRRRLRQAQ